MAVPLSTSHLASSPASISYVWKQFVSATPSCAIAVSFLTLAFAALSDANSYPGADFYVRATSAEPTLELVCAV